MADDDELDPRTKAAETKKRRTRERAINKTIDLFSIESLSQLNGSFPTVELIAEEAHVGVATIYTHFETKYGLYRAALEQLFGEVARPIRAAIDLGTYSPPDLRPELISYVHRLACTAQEYRYLVASYIQAYFEVRAYDPPHRARISDPVVHDLKYMLNTYKEPDRFNRRFQLYPETIPDHMDTLLTLSTVASIQMPWHEQDRAVHVAATVLRGLLRDVDSRYTENDFPEVLEQLRKSAT